MDKLNDRPKPYFATLISLVAVVTMCWLGVWQMQRAEQKQTRLEQIQQRQANDPLTLAELIKMEGDNRDVPFRVVGDVNPSRYFLLDNRIESGKVGYQVLVPVATNEGLLLVNYGFVAGSQYREKLPEVALIGGAQILAGISSQPLENPMVQETAMDSADFPVVVQAIDLEFISQFLSEPLLPLVMQLNPDDSSAFIRNWRPVVMSPEKHYAYALQWFGLAIASLLVYFFAIIKRNPKHE